MITIRRSWQFIFAYYRSLKAYRTISLPVVLYGCETWSLTLREERKLRVFENMVLRRIFGPRSDEVTGEWRRLHNEELNDLYCSPNIVRVIKSRRMRWAGLDGPGIESRWGARFSSPVQTGLGVHPASYTMATSSLSSG